MKFLVLAPPFNTRRKMAKICKKKRQILNANVKQHKISRKHKSSDLLENIVQILLQYWKADFLVLVCHRAQDVSLILRFKAFSAFFSNYVESSKSHMHEILNYTGSISDYEFEHNYDAHLCYLFSHLTTLIDFYSTAGVRHNALEFECIFQWKCYPLTTFNAGLDKF